MPKLQLFVACERILTDSKGQLSIIGVIEGFTAIPTEEGASIPADAIAPVDWMALTGWHRGDDESPDTLFEQRIILATPSAKKVLEGHATFRIPKTVHRQTLTVKGFPLSEVGTYRLTVQLRSGPSEEWSERGAWEIAVNHARDKEIVELQGTLS